MRSLPKRRWFWLSMLGMTSAAAFFVSFLLASSPTANLEGKFEYVQLGMTLPEVIEVMGRPHFRVQQGNDFVYYWQERKRFVYVTFGVACKSGGGNGPFEAGKVEEKYAQEEETRAWEDCKSLTRQWLGL